jgi:hypothetical protein
MAQPEKTLMINDPLIFNFYSCFMLIFSPEIRDILKKYLGRTGKI